MHLGFSFKIENRQTSYQLKDILGYDDYKHKRYTDISSINSKCECNLSLLVHIFKKHPHLFIKYFKWFLKVFCRHDIFSPTSLGGGLCDHIHFGVWFRIKNQTALHTDYSPEQQHQFPDNTASRAFIILVTLLFCFHLYLSFF